MVNRNFFILIFIIIFSFFASPNFAYSFESAAPYAYLLDYKTNTPLYEKSAQEQMAPSSMTKIMTAYVVFKNFKDGNLKLEDEFNVSKNAWSTGGTKMFVKLNSEVKVEDLIRGIIVQSGNDACKVLAEGIYGDEATFAEKMNEYAETIGMTDTSFKNASGLPQEGHYTTAKDLAILGSAIIREFHEYYHYFSEAEFTYNNIHQYNRNTLVGKRGVDGIKTGHADEAGYGMVISAIRDNRRLIAVVNGLPNGKTRIEEAEKLLNYGFSNFTYKKLFSAEQIIAQADVWYGVKDKVNLISRDDLEIVLPKSASKKSKSIIKIVYNSPLPAPIKKHSVIAQLIIEEDGNISYRKDLLADEDINEATFIQRATINLKYMVNKLLNS